MKLYPHPARTGPLFRVLMKRDKVAEVPAPPTNVRLIEPEEVAEPAKLSDEEVLYALEPDRPYDVAVDGL